ncbi:MAG TPA: arginase family protein [Holophaga sp.]|nr:arginase family protein [Holophaga sp.]
MNPESLLNVLRSGLTPFLGLELATEPGALPIPAPGVVLGAPYDGGVLNRPGARLGPWALRNASMGLGRSPMPLRLQGVDEGGRGLAAVDWVDGGNIPTRPFNQAEALEAVDQTHSAWIAQGARTLMLGGDHLMTLGALRAHARKHGPLGLLHLDAHPDAAQGDLWGSKLHHGTWVRAAIEEGLIDPHRTVQIGLRAPRFDSEELVFLADAGVHMWTPWDLKDARLGTQLQGDIARVGQGPAYVSLDLDVLDPAFCPAVAEPVPGGLSPMDLFPLMRNIHRWPQPWVGADLMELAPSLPGGEETARVASHLALQLLA